jgi:regulator of protease activity HflC (stomatin/prohibitin superfamily)
MRIVVQEWERVLVYRDGRFQRTLGPGRHRVTARRHRFAWTSLRPRLLTVPVQEVLTRDGLAVKVSLLATVRVADARAWHEAVDQPDAFLYAALQTALREEIASRTLEELLADRSEAAQRMLAVVAPAVVHAGLAVDALAVRDVVVPAEVRRASAAVVTARAEGQAALERARAEVAATRALANAAKMVETHPGLLQLRTLQAVEAGGATVVLSAEPGAATARATA